MPCEVANVYQRAPAHRLLRVGSVKTSLPCRAGNARNAVGTDMEDGWGDRPELTAAVLSLQPGQTDTSMVAMSTTPIVLNVVSPRNFNASHAHPGEPPAIFKWRPCHWAGLACDDDFAPEPNVCSYAGDEICIEWVPRKHFSEIVTPFRTRCELHSRYAIA